MKAPNKHEAKQSGSREVAMVAKEVIKKIEVPALIPSERARLTKLVAAVEKFQVQEGAAFTAFNNLLKLVGTLQNEMFWIKQLLAGKLNPAPAPQAFLNRQTQVQKIGAVQASPERPLTARTAPPPRLPSPPSSPSRDTENGELPRGERRCLIATAQHPDGVTREQLTVLVGYKRSARDTYLQRLRARGYVCEEGGRLLATGEGIAALGTDYERLPTGQALIDHWRAKLTGGELVIFEAIVAQYPEAVERESLEQSTGYKRSARDTYIQRLKSRRVIELVGRGEIRAAEQLFNE